jgi:hypothetical protein
MPNDGIDNIVWQFQHLFFLTEVATKEKKKAFYALKKEVSTPFLPNGSRYKPSAMMPDPTGKCFNTFSS